MLGIRIPSTASILKGQMNKDEILFSLSLTHTVIIVARDKIENVSALIYNIVISMTYLSLSGNSSGENMGTTVVELPV